MYGRALKDEPRRPKGVAYSQSCDGLSSNEPLSGASGRRNSKPGTEPWYIACSWLTFSYFVVLRRITSSSILSGQRARQQQ